MGEYTNNLKKGMKKIKVKEEKEIQYVIDVNGKKIRLDDSVQIGMSYYHKSDPSIVKEDLVDDTEEESYVLKKMTFRFYDSLTNEKWVDTNIIRYTRREKRLIQLCLVQTSIGDQVWFRGLKTLLDAGYIECIHTGIFYHPSNSTAALKTKTGQYRKVNATKHYSTLTSIDNHAYHHKYGLDSPTYRITEGKRYTFGCELETCSGLIPGYLDDQLNYSAVHDGSLRDPVTKETRGGEYVTGVFKGDMGFKQLKLLCNILSERCQINYQCGVHFHFGDINFTKENIVYIYYLARKLETEIASLLPKSRRNNEYCKKLKAIPIDLTQQFKFNFDYKEYIDDIYNKILVYVSSQNSIDPTMVNKKHNHPKGDKCNYDHSTARYAWLNFVPAMFDTREGGPYTIEFRNMNGSLNYLKIRNWALICMSLIYVCENHKDFIKSNKDINLNDVIKLSYPIKGEELMRYIQIRKDKFADHGSKEEEEEYTEITEDKNLSLKNL